MNIIIISIYIALYHALLEALLYKWYKVKLLELYQFAYDLFVTDINEETFLQDFLEIRKRSLPNF